MPRRRLGVFAHADAVEALGQRKQAGKNFWQRKIWPQFLLRDLKAARLQPFSIERNVPGIEPAPGKAFKVREFLLAGGAAPFGQFAEELAHLAYVLCHSGGERELGKVV